MSSLVLHTVKVICSKFSQVHVCIGCKYKFVIYPIKLLTPLTFYYLLFYYLLSKNDLGFKIENHIFPCKIPGGTWMFTRNLLKNCTSQKSTMQATFSQEKKSSAIESSTERRSTYIHTRLVHKKMELSCAQESERTKGILM